MAGSRDEIRWSPYIEGQWIASMSVDHACLTITGADKMKWNEMDEMSVEKLWNEICGMGKWENPRFVHTKSTWSDRDLNSGLQQRGMSD